MGKVIVVFISILLSWHAVAERHADCAPLSDASNASKLKFLVNDEGKMFAIVDGQATLCEQIPVPLGTVRVIQGRQVGIWQICGDVNYLNGPWIGNDDPGFFANHRDVDYRCDQVPSKI